MEAQKIWWRRLNLGRSKLKASARASALLSGFAMVALVEIQLNNENEVPTALLVGFVICTTLLIAVHMLSLMIATCILPHIESVAIIPGTVEYSANDGAHDRMKNYIETSWFFSTTVGIFLFLVEIDLICWVKFWNYGASSGTNVGKIASISVTIALIPIFVLFIAFAVKFYRNLVSHQFEKSEREILELDTLINQLHLHGSRRDTPISLPAPAQEGGRLVIAVDSEDDIVKVPGQLSDFHIIPSPVLTKQTRTTIPLIDEDYLQEDQTLEEQEESTLPIALVSSGSSSIIRAPRTESDTRSDAGDSGHLRGSLSQLDSRRLVLPQMQQIKARFNQGCVGGTKCQFFALCWMSGGSLGASCGLLMTCCVTPSRQEIQPGFYGPVVNDPYCGRSTSKINRIVGGTDASFGQFPWQAFVQVGGSRCGGALISSRHVVTAGHCVARSQHSPTSIKVTLGDYILNSDIESIPHEVFSVVGVLLHPNFRFTPQADRYDVAVLELDRTALYKDNIKPICLPQKDAVFVGKTAYVAGWGALQAGSKLRPKVLQHVAVPVIENPVCESWHKTKGIDIRIYDEMMCAGYEIGQRDACQGDSGGPLMLNQYGVWYLVGIVSAGYSCAKQYQPGIYHRVSSSSDWISSKVYQQAAN